MASIRNLKEPNGNVFYPLTHERAVKDSNGVSLESKLAGLESKSYIEAWDGASTPVVANIPAGVTVTYNTTTYTGTLAASASTIGKIYLVKNGSNYDQYITSQDGSSYSWKGIGSTGMDLSGYATDEELVQLDSKLTSDGQNYIPRCTLNATGGIDGNPQWFISKDYIPVENGDTIVWNPGVANWGGSLCIYDGNKNILSYKDDTAVERTITLNTQGVAYIRAPFYMDNLANAKIIRNGVTVWTPSDKADGVEKELQNLSSDFYNLLGERGIHFVIQNGTPGSYLNTDNVLIRGEETVVIPVTPGRKYKFICNKTPASGNAFYFRPSTYSTVSPATFTSNRIRTWSENWDNYVENGGVFTINSSEVGLSVMVSETTSPNSSGTYTPIRETDFVDGDIQIIDITNSVIDELRYDIDTKMSNTVKYSVFSPVKGKYITDSGGSKLEASNSKISYIEIPIDKIDARICLTGFSYTPSPASADTYTSLVYFDGNDNLLSRENTTVNGVMSLAKPNGAASCYINAPVAYIDELSVFTDMGTTEEESGGAGIVMTAYSATKNVSFGPSSLTIGKNGFSYIANGVKYDIAGSTDFVFAFYDNHTRRYLCIDSEELKNGNRSFADVLTVLDETTPAEKYVVLMATYLGLPQGGLFFDEYLRARQEADTVGASLIVNYETKGKDFSALFADAQDSVSFLFFTDPHTASGASYNAFGTQLPMLKTIQQYYQSLPFDFVLSGGDWLNNSDTQAQACYKLGQIKQQLKTRLSPCYLILGNHDTNYQGVALSQDSIDALWFNDLGKSYYRVERHNCSLYIFDSGTDGRTTISAFEQEQLAWFAQSLYAETSPNIIIASHIIVAGSSAESSVIQPFAEAIEQIAGAYNSRSNVTVNGYEYQFNTVTGNGKVRCFIGGHTHYDYMDTTQPIPIFITLNTLASNVLAEIWGNAVSPRFDMILIDFTEGKLHAVRVGDGSDRTMALA